MALESFLSSSLSIGLNVGYSGVEDAQTSRLSGLDSCAIGLGEAVIRFRETEKVCDTSRLSLKWTMRKAEISCLVVYSTPAINYKIVSSGRNLGILEG